MNIKKNPMDIRAECALVLRRSGLTFKTIGRILGICGYRAREYTLRGLRAENEFKRRKGLPERGPESINVSPKIWPAEWKSFVTWTNENNARRAAEAARLFKK